MSTAETQAKILSASIALFNERMASNVSTVQISKELGISTGNMYYYYKNKEHIIRSLWQDEIQPALDRAAEALDSGRSEHGIIEGFSALADVVMRYRFFFAEAPALLHNDPELRGLYRTYFLSLTHTLCRVMEAWMELGIMLPVDAQNEQILAESLWCVTQSVPFLLPAGGEEGADAPPFEHVYAFLRPYLSYASNERIRRLLLMQQTARQTGR